MASPEQDRQKKWADEKKKKIHADTFCTFLIATLAIAGIPPFCWIYGFASEDEILWARLFRQGSTVLSGFSGAFGARMMMTGFSNVSATSSLPSMAKDRALFAPHILHPPNERWRIGAFDGGCRFVALAAFQFSEDFGSAAYLGRRPIANRASGLNQIVGKR